MQSMMDRTCLIMMTLAFDNKFRLKNHCLESQDQLISNRIIDRSYNMRRSERKSIEMMAYCHFVSGSEQLDIVSVNDEELRMMGGS